MDRSVAAALAFLVFVLICVGGLGYSLAAADRQIEQLRERLGELPDVVTIAREDCPCGPQCDCCPCRRREQ